MSASASRITESVVEQTTLGYSMASTQAINLHTTPHKHHNHIPSEVNNP